MPATSTNPDFFCAGIHPILDADWWQQAPEALRHACQPEAIATAIARLPIPLVQLRAKGDEAHAWRFMHDWMLILRRCAPGVRVVLNDRVAWVERLQADGVHVGQGDTPVAECRRQLGAGRLIGLSTHSLTELREAERVAVDYVGFGPVFVTNTKTDTGPLQGVAALTRMAASTRLPIVAIGGITLDRVADVADTGAAAAAMISALWQQDWQSRLERACRLWQKRDETG